MEKRPKRGKYFPVVDGKKICNVCGENKKIIEFNKNSATGNPQAKCKKCYNKRQMERKREQAMRVQIDKPKPKDKRSFWDSNKNPITMLKVN